MSDGEAALHLHVHHEDDEAWLVLTADRPPSRLRALIAALPGQP